MEKIFVTQSFLPPIEEYQAYIRQLWESRYLTNQGPLLKQFEHDVSDYLGLSNFHFVTNGTTALQLALRALEITEGEIITTPFSFVATTSAILWERCTPVFVDIEPETFNIDGDKIEAAITDKTKAILAVHVFGNPCAVEKIESIAKRHNLKVIYDAAHAFGVKVGRRSLLSYGDIATCSFHATKVFHTVEGGAVIAADKNVSERVELIKKFGFIGDDHITLGINAKASEIHAAMGLCNLKYVNDVIAQRKVVSSHYDSMLPSSVRRPVVSAGTEYNYAYYPVLLKDEAQLHRVMRGLQDENVFPRRYFYPSLNKIPYVGTTADCPVSEDIASRILCLPLYGELSAANVARICKTITSVA